MTTALFKALGDTNRLRAVAALLRYEELCACHLVELLGIRGATVSRHMGQLIRCKIVQSRKKGRWVLYRLTQSEEMSMIIELLKERLVREPFWKADGKRLEKMLAENLEDLCRKQLGEECCQK